MNTQPIQIFIAATPELESELNSIHDLIQQVNKHFRARGYELQAVDGDSADFVQDLHESDLCLALYCNQFGSFTQEHLEEAYKELCENRNPKKIYIYFKNTDAITEELRAFRDSFSEKYGHFYCCFENVDTMRLNFLLQCENYMTKHIGQEGLLKVCNSKIEINGEEVADLLNIPFASNNKSFQKLLQDIQEAQTAVLQDASNPKLWQKVYDLQEERSKREEAMLRVARFITKQSNEVTSERLSEAMRLFEAGETEKVNEILNDDIIEQEIADRKRKIDAARDEQEENKKGLEMNIKEWQLKIENIQTEMPEGWFEQVTTLYDKTISAARGYINDEDLADLLVLYGVFLQLNRQYHLIGNLFEESLSIYRKLAEDDHDKYDSCVALRLAVIGESYQAQHQYELAESKLTEALDIFRLLIEQTPEKYNKDLAMCLGALGGTHCLMYKYEQAEKELNESLCICQCLAKDNPDAYDVDIAMVLLNKGYMYLKTKKISQAENSFAESLIIFRRLAKDEPLKERNLSVVLLDIGALHFEQHQYEQAEKELTESLAISQRLAIKNPLVHNFKIAMALMDLGVIHHESNQKEQAEKELKEALSMYQQLAENNPQAYNSFVAQVLLNLGRLHQEMQQYELAEKELNDALSIFQSPQYAGMFQVDSALALLNLAVLHACQKQYELAEKESEEALLTYRRLAENNSGVYDFEIARAKRTLGGVYICQKKIFQATIEIQEALRLYRKLQAHNPVYDKEIEQLENLLRPKSKTLYVLSMFLGILLMPFSFIVLLFKRKK